MPNGNEQIQGRKITAEEAAQIISQEGINPRHLLVVLQILMNIKGSELGKLIQMITGEGGQPAEAPAGRPVDSVVSAEGEEEALRV